MTTTHEPEIDVCKRMCNNVEHMQTTTATYYEPNSSFYTQVYPADSQQPDIAGHLINEEGYWGSPSSSDHSIHNPRDYSPINILNQPSSPSPSSSSFHQYATVYYPSQFDRPDQIYDEGYYGGRRATTTSTTITNTSTHLQSVPFVRVVKRRTTANKKERRRTQSINSAFSYLRECIPNVPSDTKLSKIKTLRLATSYISYLTEVLKGHQDPSSGFRAELVPSSRKINAERRAKYEAQGLLTPESIEFRKCKGRTGWPQHVWASELKQEQQ